MAEQPRTTITFEKPRRVGGPEIITLDVPFSQAEIDAIREARAAQKRLGPYVTQGSGTSRELALNFPVPWGYSLTDRTQAVERLGKTREYLSSRMTPESERFLQREEIELLRHIQAMLGDLFPQEG